MHARHRDRAGDQPENKAAHGQPGGQVFVRLAAILLIVAAASVALLPVYLPDRGRKGAGPRPTSWAMPPLAARAVGGGGWTWDAIAAAPVALIYVDRKCFHCKAEMERWEALARELDFDSHVWVVASPESEMDEARWVPPSLRGRTVHDVDGSVRAQLGVRAVPTTFWVDAADTVRIVKVGQSGRQMLMDNVLTIRGLEKVNE